ncbi:hypothetical protein F443_18711 [Phytophthora nicotianae P1569]|uniref:Uncharacterized protein n=1 Tax=Phytophthora nicotianae P1569 TaxID=1317065 RepID=V9E7C5_PHYNI|nr:hypothetical protein F443_18711 [Phytophthora nicotianae P1569]
MDGCSPMSSPYMSATDVARADVPICQVHSGNLYNTVNSHRRDGRSDGASNAVDSSASNGFVRVESLSKLNFEVVEVPRRVLEVRWTTGAGEARPINWKKRMIVHFGRNETESYGSVSVVHVPHGVSDHVVEVAPKAVASGANKQATTTAGVVASVPILNSD